MSLNKAEALNDLQKAYEATYKVDLSHDQALQEFEQQLAIAIQTAQKTFPEAGSDPLTNPTQLAYIRTLLMEIEDQPTNQI